MCQRTAPGFACGKTLAVGWHEKSTGTFRCAVLGSALQRQGRIGFLNLLHLGLGAQVFLEFAQFRLRQLLCDLRLHLIQFG